MNLNLNLSSQTQRRQVTPQLKDVPAIPVTPAGQTANVQQPALLQDDDILRVREDADVWIAPRSGIRFHFLGECDGLRRACQARRLMYGQLQFEFPGQYECQLWTRELARRQDIARLATMYHILHVHGRQLPNPMLQILPEPEPHDDTSMSPITMTRVFSLHVCFNEAELDRRNFLKRS